jgi:hypothetical protein
VVVVARAAEARTKLTLAQGLQDRAIMVDQEQQTVVVVAVELEPLAEME